LGFTGTTQTHTAGRTGSSAAAACLTLKMCPCAGEAGEVVFVLGELHLQHAFFGMGMLSEDIEDQRGAVNDADVLAERFSNSRWWRGESSSSKMTTSARVSSASSFEFFHLAGTDVGFNMRAAEFLGDLANHIHTGGICQQASSARESSRERIVFIVEFHAS
jgi:hypothetical protein